MKTSKVKAVQGNGTYDSQHGLLYNFEYQMEDGAVLNANHKTQNPLPVGTEVEYFIKGSNETSSWGSVKRVQEQSNYSNKKPNSGQASFALSYAKDLAVGGVIQVDEIIKKATEFNTWLKENQ